MCVGDPVFAYRGTSAIEQGKVEKIEADGRVVFKSSSSRSDVLPRQNIASTRAGACAPTGVNMLCPGQGTERAAAPSQQGITLAVFPTGYIVVAEPGSAPVSLKAETFKPRALRASDDAALKRALTDFAYIQKLAKLEPACPTCGTSAAPTAPNPAAKKPGKHGLGSFAQLILNQEPTITQAFKSRCTQFLRRIYRSGKTLYSERIAAAGKPTHTYPFTSGGEKLDFFHYTNTPAAIEQFYPEMTDRAEAHRRCLQEQCYEKMLRFLRSTSASWLTGGLYVAEDPISSSSFGTVRIRLFLQPNALILDDTATARSSSRWADTMKDLNIKFPGISTACPSYVERETFSQADWHFLQFLIAEDSGIDLIDYNSDRHHQWFRLIRTDKITGTEVRKEHQQ